MTWWERGSVQARNLPAVLVEAQLDLNEPPPPEVRDEPVDRLDVSAQEMGELTLGQVCVAMQHGLPRYIAKDLFLSFGEKTLLATPCGTLGFACLPVKRATS